MHSPRTQSLLTGKTLDSIIQISLFLAFLVPATCFLKSFDNFSGPRVKHFALDFRFASPSPLIVG